MTAVFLLINCDIVHSLTLIIARHPLIVIFNYRVCIRLLSWSGQAFYQCLLTNGDFPAVFYLYFSIDNNLSTLFDWWTLYPVPLYQVIWWQWSNSEYLPTAFCHPMHNDILMTIYQFSIDLDLLYPFDYQWSIDGLVLPPIDGHLSIFFLT